MFFKGLKIQLTIYSLIIVLPVVLIISSISYDSSLKTLRYNMRLLETQAVENIDNSVSLIETSYQMLGSSFDKVLIEGLDSLERYYNTNFDNLDQINFDKLKSYFSKDYDFYLINSLGIIQYSSRPEAIGIDFKQFPRFWMKFVKILIGQNITEIGLLSSELDTGVIKKWAYRSSFDNRYVLEVGISAESFGIYLDQINYKKQIEKVISINPRVKTINVYDDKLYNIVSLDKMENEKRASSISRAFTLKRDELSYIDGQRVIYKYIGMGRFENSIDNINKVAEIYIDETEYFQKSNQTLMSHILIGFVVILLIFAIAYLLSYKITSPVKEMIDMFSLVSEGSFISRYDIQFNNELDSLFTAFNKMSENLDKITVSRDLLNHEVAERRKSQAELEEALSRVNAIFESSNVGIVLIRDTVVIEANPRIYEMLGYDQSEEIMVMNVLKSEESYKILQEGFHDSLKIGSGFTKEFNLVKKDGKSIDVLLSGNPLDKNNIAKGVIWVITEITELKEARKEIMHLERKNSILAMIATANHEINQPLTALLGNVDLLSMSLDRATMSPNQLKFLSRIHESVSKVNAILSKYRNAQKFKITKYVNKTNMVDFDLTESEGSIFEDFD